MTRYPQIKGGCRVRSCPKMRHTCPNRWHWLLNLGARRG